MYTYKLKKRYKAFLFLIGRERPAMHRSGQFLFLPYAKLKQREKTSTGHLLCFVTATYVLKSQNGFIKKWSKVLPYSISANTIRSFPLISKATST
ncbi:hypothetical protein CON65_06565 [Bacillus pseudomycoides]|uniref:Uncharacterized protein n=1 Tax=Bacillus pseudomycoides TaxID=64104 RepID=A0AA91ZU80_9BACI|nr:hypothetical protein COO03_12295 [Bacillus sp. AFS098217]PED83530.1 hypothetical protein CON65_06565 [Bacillus pseudomycoides]PEU06965.1 hypothetical protein CN524_22090 [Bacillus sp. AFS019443]PEU21961.1 hypothetical protein CN525_00740 [Bacillus sp. AFS014408]PFW63160.1 hypothetical protein COL20_09965 [Bacillus sp. AFS075034]